MSEKSILLSTAYFAPIQYYSKFINHTQIYVEQFEHFNKQTYRNRCVIPGGNGLIQLIVPVVKGRGPKILIKDLKIALMFTTLTSAQSISHTSQQKENT